MKSLQSLFTCETKHYKRIGQQSLPNGNLHRVGSDPYLFRIPLEIVVWRKSWETAKKSANGIKGSCKLSIGGSVPLLLRLWNSEKLRHVYLYTKSQGARYGIAVLIPHFETIFFRLTCLVYFNVNGAILNQLLALL